MDKLPRDPMVVYFDGNCATCHHIVHFLLQRLRRHRFSFVPLQSLKQTPWETAIREQLGLDLSSSLVIWKNGELRARAAAVFAIFAELGWPWNLILLLRVIPLFISDYFYDLYAKNRYRILGSAKNPDICALIPPELRPLFPASYPKNLPIFPPRHNVFASAQWRQLILINYALPPEVLKPYLPAGVELDTWQGETLVSLVAFAFTGLSLSSMNLPICSDFEEINLRFYVKRAVSINGKSVIQRGVVFIKEIVPFALIAKTANGLYKEHYVVHETDSNREERGSQLRISYSWKNRAQACSISAVAHGEPEDLQVDSLAEFITEHYFGYTKQNQDFSLEYEVEHPRWRVWNPIEFNLSGNISSFYPQAVTQHMIKVHSAFLAEGSAVRMLRKKSIPTSASSL